MAKKNFQKTPLERAQHEKAVKVRKMTDSQLCDFLDTMVAEAQSDNTLKRFFKVLDENSYRGIGIATIAKLKNIAIKEGIIEEV